MMNDHIGHIVSIRVAIAMNAMDDSELHIVHANKSVGCSDSLEQRNLSRNNRDGSCVDLYHSWTVRFCTTTPDPCIEWTDRAEFEPFTTVDGAFFVSTTDEDEFSARFLLVSIFDQPTQGTRIIGEFTFFARLIDVE